jgi:hypothetical protein
MSRLEMKKFTGTKFELWMLKMENLLIDEDLWVQVFGTKLAGMKDESGCCWRERQKTLSSFV